MRFPLAVFLFGCGAAAAEEPVTRAIVPEEVVRNRPKPTSPRPVSASVAPRYRPAASGNAAMPRESARQLGITIWRLRSAQAGDGPVRILVQDDAGPVEWVPERVPSTSVLRAGDRVRLSVESPETGYLYVIDRERYSNGQRGDPYLIFPTARTRNGDNRVRAGQLIDIPAQDDRPNFFRLSQSRLDQVEEELTVLLSPQPIAGIEIGPRAKLLPAAKVAEWEKTWGAGKVQLFELSGGAGKSWTRAEQMAAADTTRALTQEDPAPQTVYRVTGSGAQDPFLVRVRLRYR